MRLFIYKSTNPREHLCILGIFVVVIQNMAKKLNFKYPLTHPSRKFLQISQRGPSCPRFYGLGPPLHVRQGSNVTGRSGGGRGNLWMWAGYRRTSRVRATDARKSAATRHFVSQPFRPLSLPRRPAV